MNTNTWTLTLLSSVFMGCATATPPPVVDNHNGKMSYMPRRDLELTGHPYALQHRGAHPQPGGASGGVRGPGGEISGTHCGAQVMLQVEHQGDHVAVAGAVDRELVRLRMVERAGQRFIEGVIGTRSVEISLSQEGISGHIGASLYDLVAQGDRWTNGRPHLGQAFAIAGKAALWSMAPAQQMVVVPLTLSCLEGMSRAQLGVSELSFGGMATAVPRGTLALSD